MLARLHIYSFCSSKGTPLCFYPWNVIFIRTLLFYSSYKKHKFAASCVMLAILGFSCLELFPTIPRYPLLLSLRNITRKGRQLIADAYEEMFSIVSEWAFQNPNQGEPEFPRQDKTRKVLAS
jgi:hypothetical protein